VSLHQVVDAVLGGSQSDSLEHLCSRIEHCARLAPRDARRYLVALRAAMPRNPPAEMREAQLLLSLGQLQAAQELDFDPVTPLLDLAEVREREGRVQRASSWLTIGWQMLVQDGRIASALEAFRSRQLARTRAATEHLAKADAAARGGHLRRAEKELEALRAIEPRHPHAGKVALAIADRRRKRQKARGLLLARLAGTGLTLLVLGSLFLWETRARSAYQDLAPAQAEAPETVELRLVALERFMRTYPIWLGAIAAVEERARLKVQVGALKRRASQAPILVAAVAPDLTREAEQLYFEGRRLAEAERFQDALEQFEEALRLAPDDWPRRDRVTRDIAALSSLEGE
jgi:tetratricopeptide (TPR) repeat protein